jgi:hypothetical protein
MVTKPLIFAGALAFLAVTAAQAQAPATNTEQAQMKAYVEMLRKDVRKDAQSIVDQAMGLDAAGKAKFWAVYKGYQDEQKALWDQRLANIRKYAENYGSLTDDVADQIANASMANEQQNQAIRKKYYAQMKAALGAKVAARFLQVEMLLGNLIALQLGDEIPLIR